MKGILSVLLSSIALASPGQCAISFSGQAIPGNCTQPTCVGLTITGGAAPFTITSQFGGTLAAGHAQATFVDCDFNNTGGFYTVTDVEGCSVTESIDSYHAQPGSIEVIVVHQGGNAGLQFTILADTWDMCNYPQYVEFYGPVDVQVPMAELISQGVYTVMGLPAGQYFGQGPLQFGCGMWLYCIEVPYSAYLLSPGDTGVNLSLTGALAGAMQPDGMMSDALRAAGLLPLSEPFVALGCTYTGTIGTTSTPALFSVTGDHAVVDWVVVELRAAASPHGVLSSRPALITRNGVVRDLDGDPYVNFPGISPGTYRVAIKHRNHLGIMSGANQFLSDDPSVLVDLGDIGGVSLYGGPSAVTVVGGTRCLWPGDANFDGVVKYSGANNDRDVVLQAVGGSSPSNTLANVYHGADVNMDGTVKYTGTANDRDLILQTIGGVVPTAVKVEQVP